MKIIHVDQFALNKKTGKFEIDKPPFVVLLEDGQKFASGYEVEIYGPSRLVFSETDHPVYGARAWIETDAYLKIK